MTESIQRNLVACCKPQPAQHATTAATPAAERATRMHQPSLKALALLALGRNNESNTHATTPERSSNNNLFWEGGALREVRARLEGIAHAESIDPALVVALSATDLEACADLPDALLAYVGALRDRNQREHGKAPADETAAALCRRCGPVWLHPDVASIAPVVNGWPHVLGCPWCHVRELDIIPRPKKERDDARR